MDDSIYFKINVATTNKVRRRLHLALCLLVIIAVLVTPQLNTPQLLLGSLALVLFSLLAFLAKTKRPTPQVILLTENGQTNLIFVKRHFNQRSLLRDKHLSNKEYLPNDYQLSQDLQIQSGSWVLFGCLHIKLQSRLSGQVTWLTLYADQILANDWCRLRRICFRCNRPVPIC